MSKIPYNVPAIKEFLRRVNCLEREDFAEFLTWVNSGNTPRNTYIDSKWEQLHKNPGMFLCLLDEDRAESFIFWVLERPDPPKHPTTPGIRRVDGAQDLSPRPLPGDNADPPNLNKD